MPFDHARCPGCQAILDPERLKQGAKGPHCPRCDTPLGMVDLFGVADAFSEDDQANLTLDDLVPGNPKPSGGTVREELSLDTLVPMRKR